MWFRERGMEDVGEEWQGKRGGGEMLINPFDHYFWLVW